MENALETQTKLMSPLSCSKINGARFSFYLSQRSNCMQNPKSYLINRILEFRRKSFRKFARKSNFEDRLPREDSEENQRKGTEFEAFVVQRFDRTYFTLVEWRSDKNIDGIFPLMSKFPDLEFYFESQTECRQFAIECKWREHFYEDSILLNQFQLENYNHYQQVTGYQTFVLLGVGNIPSSPTHVYILRLSDIKTHKLHENDIEKYRRKHPHDSFFLDYKKGELR